tara:strand:+ start:1032 stop:1394 length:363 start_codon:yes stop_codon:yes gene_type:complete
MTPMKPKKVHKEWGHELWLANNEREDYCGKILHIKEGKSTSMHYHNRKHETFYVLEGTLMVDSLVDLYKQDDKFSITCEKGSTLEMARDKAHKLIAHEGDVTLIEISTFHRDEDSFRLWR